VGRLVNHHHQSAAPFWPAAASARNCRLWGVRPAVEVGSPEHRIGGPCQRPWRTAALRLASPGAVVGPQCLDSGCLELAKRIAKRAIVPLPQRQQGRNGRAGSINRCRQPAGNSSLSEREFVIAGRGGQLGPKGPLPKLTLPIRPFDQVSGSCSVCCADRPGPWTGPRPLAHQPLTTAPDQAH